MTDDKSKREIGPTASLNRARLNEKQIELFDWIMSKLVGNDSDARFFGSMLQAIACNYPELTYWQVVEAARKISSTPDFDRNRREALQAAEASFKKPTES